MNVRGVFAELQRRRVVRVAMVYLIGAWALVQVSATVFPLLGLPEWTVRGVLLLVLFAFIPAMGLAWAFDVTPAGIVPTPAMIETRGPSELGTVDRPARSVAVLPFVNLSSDSENDYFCDGMTEDLIARLSRIGRLKVISRTTMMRYKNAATDIPRVGRELGVTSVVEGSVRRAGPQVRIVARLVTADTDEQAWGEMYDRELDDIFAIQTDVALRIAEALEARLPQAGDRARDRPTHSLHAYDLYLRGRYHWNKRTPMALRQSIELLQDAIEQDPGFALAHAALADSYLTAGFGVDAPRHVMPAAKAAARRALELDPALAEALGAIACVRATYDWDWEGAERDFVDAVQMNPQYATARAWFALNCLAPQARFEEARAQLHNARVVDPLSPVIGTCLGVLSFLEREYDRAIAECREILRAEPGFGLAHFFLGQALIEKPDLEEAVAALRTAVELTGRSDETLSALGYALGRAGSHGEADRLLAELLRRGEAGYVSPVLVAQVQVGLSRADQALDWLERGHAERATEMIWLGVRPVFDPLRGDSRFVELQERVLPHVVGRVRGLAGRGPP